ncbi:MAG: glycolate oxidase subunit GlcE, partial [Pseudomonadales bacterium]|jgi:glycolate oxidase FAD binding subunit|nr:glycolate oxidase subunit GlcE [Pseudomonadales bacterium]
VRLEGSEEAVADAVRSVGGESLEDEAAFWQGLRDLTLPFFEDPAPLWRLSVPVDAPQPALAANWFLDWGGAQRWCVTDEAPEKVLEAARALGGHALRYRPTPLRTALAPGLRALHARIREAFDPAGLFTAVPWES